MELLKLYCQLLKKVQNDMSKQLISIVIPCFNEAENIIPLYTRIKKSIQNLRYVSEIIFVNNGSTDHSGIIFKKLAEQDKQVKVIFLSRNFYKSQGAYTAGIDYSKGDAVILIDGDLQDPPEKIPDLIRKWEKGYDIVYGVRIKRKESLVRKIFYKIFYRLFKKLSYINIPLDAGDFSVLDKKVVVVFQQLQERNRYIRGLRAWVGFRSCGVPYERQERHRGFSSNSFIDNIKWAAFAIFSFSYMPLELISLLAFFTVSAAILGIIGYTISYFLNPNVPKGFQTLLLSSLFLGAIQLICFTIIAQYLKIIFEEIKRRPKYIIDKILNQ